MTLMFKMSATGVLLLLTELLAVHGAALTTYTRQTVCNLEDRIANGCYTPHAGTTTLECAANCKRKPTCTEFLFSGRDVTCYVQSSCSFLPTCSVIDAHLEFYSTTAATPASSPNFSETNGTSGGEITQTTEDGSIFTLEDGTTERPQTSVENSSNTTRIETTSIPCQSGKAFPDGACNCSQTGGKVGTNCGETPNSCWDLLRAGYPDGEYPITLDVLGDGFRMAPGYCVIRGSSVDLEFIRNSGNFDNNYTFADYQDGYHLGQKDFFIGLRDMGHIMTYAANVTATVHYESSTFRGRVWILYMNMQFTDNGLDQYLFTQTVPMTFDGSDLEPSNKSTVGLTPDNILINTFFGSSFSTEDNDNDGFTYDNCAAGSNRGWWFGIAAYCPAVNPLGMNYKVLQGPPSPRHFAISGVDLANIEQGFDYFSLSFKLR